MMLDGALPAEQSPQSWWLDGNRGEFCFFPDPKAEYPKDAVRLTQDERKVFLAIVPTTFGNWWADEFPWFMPSLRYEILEQSKTRSPDSCPDMRELRKVAENKVAEHFKKNPKVQDYHYEHLDSLLKNEDVVGRDRAFDKITRELLTKVGEMQQDERKQTPSYPLDLHYLAVLLQSAAGPPRPGTVTRRAEGLRGRWEDSREAARPQGPLLGRLRDPAPVQPLRIRGRRRLFSEGERRCQRDECPPRPVRRLYPLPRGRRLPPPRPVRAIGPPHV